MGHRIFTPVWSLGEQTGDALLTDAPPGSDTPLNNKTNNTDKKTRNPYTDALFMAYDYAKDTKEHVYTGITDDRVVLYQGRRAWGSVPADVLSAMKRILLGAYATTALLAAVVVTGVLSWRAWTLHERKAGQEAGPGRVTSKSIKAMIGPHPQEFARIIEHHSSPAYGTKAFMEAAVDLCQCDNDASTLDSHHYYRESARAAINRRRRIIGEWEHVRRQARREALRHH